MAGDIHMPHDVAAERAVIGCMMLDPECIPDVSDIVTAEDFYSPGRSRIYEAVVAVHRIGHGVETSLVLSELEAHGSRADLLGEVMECTNTIPTKHEAYATRVHKLAVARRLMRTALEVAQDGGAPIGDVDAFLDESEMKLRQACDQRGDDTVIVTAEQAVASVFASYQERAKSPGGLIGLPSGITHLDYLTSGFQPGKMYVVAGRPGTGKTSLAVQCAVHTSTKLGSRSLVVSLEMTETELATRMISSESGIDSRRIDHADLRREESEAFVNAAAAVSRINVGMVCRSGLTETAIRRIARKASMRDGLALLVVDYLGLVRPSVRDRQREREVAEMSMAFKALAMELRIPLMLCVQLNREVEKRSGKRPQLSDLRESGSIEQDADAVIFTHHAEQTKDSELLVMKNRGGPIGHVNVVYHRQTTTFKNAEQRERTPPPATGGTGYGGW